MQLYTAALTYNDGAPPGQAQVHVHGLQQILDQSHRRVAAQPQLCQPHFSSCLVEDIHYRGGNLSHLLNDWLSDDGGGVNSRCSCGSGRGVWDNDCNIS